MRYLEKGVKGTVRIELINPLIKSLKLKMKEPEVKLDKKINASCYFSLRCQETEQKVQ